MYDGQGNIVQSIDITNGKCYNYEYEEGRIIRATESDITLSGEVITAKAVVNTIRYDYDAEGQLTKKVITPTSGSGQTIYYETGDENTVVKFSAGGRTVTSHSKTDSFGRKTFDELQLGTDFVSRQFVYHAGKVTQEHKDKEKVKSSATTQLVSQIILSNGTTLFYNYDGEERITSVMESCMVDGVPVTNTTRYTYDALGQLLTETVNGLVVNSMEYDNYGNIVKKNGKVYTYGDAAWKDLLTSYNGQAITYDAQGNPTEYLGHTLTWEKGRQLKKFVKSDGTVIDYAYNANGIRTSKTVNGVLHTYTLDGTKILREEWGGNTIVPMYDNEDSVCGIQYNDVPYYFIKNLQGDVIAIVDKDAQTVAKYAYDAWGVCTITQDTTDCNIANMNPYRYRGYYFDAEIGLYYVSSRYYDSQIASWLSSDYSAVLTFATFPISCSLFAYCCNNPVNNVDLAGYLAFSVAVIVSAAVVGAVLNAISQIAFNYLSGKRGMQIFKGVLGAAVGGAVNSALLLVLWYVPGSNVIAGFIAGFIQSVIDALFDVLVYKTLSWKGFLKECTVNGLWNSAANVAGNYLGGKLVYINRGWFKPQYVASFLKGSYGQRLIAQTGIGTILNLIVNLVRKLFKL